MILYYTFESIIYTLIYYLLLPIIIIRTLIKDGGSLVQKLGFVQKTQQQTIHFHCVSVGEFNAAIILIDKFLAQNYNIVITTTTKTGNNACKNHYGNKVILCYFPFDIPFAVKRFLNRVNPQISIILETEIWVNFSKICDYNNIKLFLINARLSNKSYNKYQKFAKLSKKTLNNFNLIATQDEESLQRFKRLGVERVQNFGNLKFDMQINLKSRIVSNLKNMINNRQIVVCASTHFNEEELVIRAYKKNKIPQLLVIIPRHPQRFKIVEKFLKNNNINYIKQSDNLKVTQQTEVLLADSMGCVLEFYSLCDIAFVGGSLVNVGGHNILEAIALQKVVIFGDNMFNFAKISTELLQNNACVQVKNADELFDCIKELSNNPDKYSLLKDNASKFFHKNYGVSDKLFDILLYN